MKKICLAILCLFLVINSVLIVNANENDDKTQKMILIISENCIYTPSKLSGLSSYISGDDIHFKLNDGTRVHLVQYQVLELTVEKYNQLRKQFEARNYIFIE